MAFVNPMLSFLAQVPELVRKPILILADMLIVYTNFFLLGSALNIGLNNRQTSEVVMPIALQNIAPECLIFLFVPAIFLLLNLYSRQINYFNFLLVQRIAFSQLVLVSALQLSEFLMFQMFDLLFGVLFFIYNLTGFIALRGLIWFAFRITPSKSKTRVAIYGAGEAGVMTIRALKQQENAKVCMLIDDDIEIQGRSIENLPVISFEQAKRDIIPLGIETVVLSMPSVKKERIADIFSQLANFKLEIKSVPELSNLTINSSRIGEIAPFSVSQLLSRNPVKPNIEMMKKTVLNKTVLVTGAGGSIGGEISRQVLSLRPTTLILLDVSEAAIYLVLQEIEQLATFEVEVVPEIGSCSDRHFLEYLFKRYEIDTIYHAAAYKHVPLMEGNVIPAFKNNVLGTAALLDLSIKWEVKSFTLISSDKAVKPTNIMGASKRLAELYCLYANSLRAETKISIVRFGNVMGSSGSVLPLFERQVKGGGPVTVTHPDVTRYFMTISEASQLVIQSAGIACGGEVFVLEMGTPIKIIEIAKKIINILGFQYYFEGDTPIEGGIEIQITGLRPGEKMYEELTHSDNLKSTSIDKVKTAYSHSTPHIDGKKLIKIVEDAIAKNDVKKITALSKRVADYRPLM